MEEDVGSGALDRGANTLPEELSRRLNELVGGTGMSYADTIAWSQRAEVAGGSG
jgi:hypothetical protein